MTSAEQTEAPETQLPVAPSLVRQAALHELERLNPFVQSLSLNDWSTPSAASGWTVGDVVAHLNVTLNLYASLLDAAKKGWAGSSAWKNVSDLSQKVVPSASGALNTINNVIPRMIKGALSPEVIKGQFAGAVRRNQQRIEHIGSADYTRPIYYMGREWPLSFFLTGVVNELAMHGWDMQFPLDPDAHLSAEARAVLPWFYWGGTPWMFRPPQTLSGGIQVELRDPDFAMWWTLDHGNVQHGIGHARAHVIIRGEAGTFVLVLAGRIKPQDALLATSITAEGEEDLARTFLGSWKII